MQKSLIEMTLAGPGARTTLTNKNKPRKAA
jgi:hypothetical protein